VVLGDGGRGGGGSINNKEETMRAKSMQMGLTGPAAEVDRLPDEALFGEWEAAMGKRLPRAGRAAKWLVRLGLKYHREIAERKRALKIIPVKMWKRYEMAKRLDEDGIRRESEFLTPKYDKARARGGKVKKTKRDDDARDQRPTASAVLIPLLGARAVETNESIIEKVKRATGSTLFNQKQLDWYKWKYRQGKLKGQDGKLHAISQAPGKSGKLGKK
jgi:hypothetical protein